MALAQPSSDELRLVELRGGLGAVDPCRVTPISACERGFDRPHAEAPGSHAPALVPGAGPGASIVARLEGREGALFGSGEAG